MGRDHSDLRKEGSMKDYKELTLEGETFEGARNSFNKVLQKLLKQMSESNTEEGTIQLKVDVQLDRDTIDVYGDHGQEGAREIRMPKFSHKVASQITIKDEAKGSTDPQMELVWDEEKVCYVLKYVSNTAQRSFFDDDMKDQFMGESEPALNPPPPIGLPDPEDKVIKYHYKREYLVKMSTERLKRLSISLGLDFSSLDSRETLIEAILEVYIEPDDKNRKYLEAEVRTAPPEGNVIDGEYKEVQDGTDEQPTGGDNADGNGEKDDPETDYRNTEAGGDASDSGETGEDGPDSEEDDDDQGDEPGEEDPDDGINGRWG